MNSRADLIAAIFERHAREIGIASSCVKDEDMPARFGWAPPERGPSGFVLVYSAEVIDRQTAHLNHIMLAGYLTAILYSVDLHLVNFDIMPTEAREAVVDKLLYETAPGALRLLNAVQLKALDNNLTT